MESWSRRLWCSDRRGFRRYNVRKLPILKIASEVWPSLMKSSSKSIDTIGIGGCGLDGVEKRTSIAETVFRMNVLKEESQVSLDFYMDGVTEKPIRMIGECVYVVQLDPDKVDDDLLSPALEPEHLVWYYGIEFLRECQVSLIPIIDRLDFLTERGYIRIAD